jgi:uncharacterized membrane protein YdbT with pleckstrin-like domain
VASYVESVLTPGERVVHLGRVSAWSQFWLWLIGALLLVFVIGLIFWIVAWIRIRTTELAVTERRVIAKFGLIRRDTIEIKVERIESVQVNQSVLGRLLNFGTIVFSGAGTPQLTVPDIAEPLEFRKAVVGAQEPPAAQAKRLP